MGVIIGCSHTSVDMSMLAEVKKKVLFHRAKRNRHRSFSQKHFFTFTAQKPKIK